MKSSSKLRAHLIRPFVVIPMIPHKLTGPKSVEEFTNLTKQVHFKSISFAYFPTVIKEVSENLSRQSGPPSGRNHQLQPVLEFAKTKEIPVFAVGRHKSHSLIRFSWMAWAHQNEFQKFLLRIFDFPQKFLSEFGYPFYDKMTPNLARAIYGEPAQYAVINAMKSVKETTKIQEKDFHALVIPPHMEAPIVQFLNDNVKTLCDQSAEELDEQLKVLTAKGSPYYWLLLLQVYFMIPILSLTILIRHFEDDVKNMWNKGVGGQRDGQIEGFFGTRWTRDPKRD